MEQQWYYSQAGQQLGPVSLNQLRQLRQAGQLQPTDLVWNQSMPQWATVASVPELAGATPAGPMTPSLAPQGPLGYEAPALEAVTVTPRTIEHLRGTKAWATFLGVLGIILSALMAIIGLVALVAGSASRRSDMAAISGIVYLIAAAIGMAVSAYMMSFGSRLGEFLRLRRADLLERAMDSQRSVWRLCGIIAIAYLVIMAIAILLVIVAGVSRARF